VEIKRDRLRWVNHSGHEVKISHREINKDDLAFFCRQKLAVVAQKTPDAIFADASEAKTDNDKSDPPIGRRRLPE
jgi:hypothetical protein